MAATTKPKRANFRHRNGDIISVSGPNVAHYDDRPEYSRVSDSKLASEARTDEKGAGK